jgi:hypothetical protein
MTQDLSANGKKRKAEDERSPDLQMEVDAQQESKPSDETIKRAKMLDEVGPEMISQFKVDELVNVGTKGDDAETTETGKTETNDDPSGSKGRRGDPNPYENLRWTIVKNDGKVESLVKLVALKSLFSKQLPKMPKAYIARLVFEWRHISLVILSDDPKVKDTDKEVIGSICYRPFPEMRFAEIAFCAVNSDHQVKVNCGWDHDSAAFCVKHF